MVSPLSVPAERGAIGSIELDGSHFRVVREGLHGLSLFAIGDGFLLWTTASTNGESAWGALQLLLLPQGLGSLPVPVGYQVKGRLEDPHTSVGGGGGVLKPLCVPRLQQGLAQPTGAGQELVVPHGAGAGSLEDLQPDLTRRWVWGCPSPWCVGHRVRPF